MGVTEAREILEGNAGEEWLQRASDSRSFLHGRLVLASTLYVSVFILDLTPLVSKLVESNGNNSLYYLKENLKYQCGHCT